MLVQWCTKFNSAFFALCEIMLFRQPIEKRGAALETSSTGSHVTAVMSIEMERGEKNDSAV